ncbi:MAG: hypothetical protein J6Z43_00255 [Clostridiales bacterium]|nr:hypothetical protein [Clostridiales bacterium]
MIVTNAVWEKRNLGVETVEIVLEDNDRIEDIRSTLNLYCQSEYSVIKVPSFCFDAIREVQEHGYTFIESALSLSIKPSKMVVEPRFKSIVSNCSYHEMNDEERQYLEEQIHRGIFSTDRIYVDPAFTHDAAAQRYINWMHDLSERKNPIMNVMYGNDAVGFFVADKKPGNVYDGVLAGVYEPYLNTGMGYCVQWAGVDYARTNDAQKYLGHISLNNPGVLKLLLSLGYNVTRSYYVFIRHGGNKSEYTGENF